MIRLIIASILLVGCVYQGPDISEKGMHGKFSDLDCPKCKAHAKHVKNIITCENGHTYHAEF